MTSLPRRRQSRTRAFGILLPGLALLALPLLGCGTVKGLLIRVVMDETPLPEAQIERDLVYGEPGAADPRQKLDLFRPAAAGWPLLVFVHGGSWNAGDKRLKVGSFEPYQNIGRYYATRGVGVAVLNYRLQPKATWRQQVEDVARAVGWLAGNIAERGGDPQRIFLSGHSAGAQLVAFVTTAPWLAALRGNVKVCGVIPVSGAGFDLADQETYRLGASPQFYERTFRNGKPQGIWEREASTTSYLRPGLPPFLIFYGAKEWPSLRRQNDILYAQLEKAGDPAELMVIPKLDHARMALAMSDEKKPVPEAILRFLGSQSCAEKP